MNTLTLLGLIYAFVVVSWCIFAIINRDRVMSPQNSKELNIVFLVISIVLSPICWIIGLAVVIKEKKNQKKKDWPEPVPKEFRKYLKKDTVFYHKRSISLASYNKLTGRNLTLEQVYGKKYVKSLTGEDYEQFDTVGERSGLSSQYVESCPMDNVQERSNKNTES